MWAALRHRQRFGDPFPPSREREKGEQRRSLRGTSSLAEDRLPFALLLAACSDARSWSVIDHRPAIDRRLYYSFPSFLLISPSSVVVCLRGLCLYLSIFTFPSALPFRRFFSQTLLFQRLSRLRSPSPGCLKPYERHPTRRMKNDRPLITARTFIYTGCDERGCEAVAHQLVFNIENGRGSVNGQPQGE